MTDEKLNSNDKVVMLLDLDLGKEVRRQAEERGVSEDVLVSEVINTISKLISLYEDEEISRIIENRSQERGLSKISFAARIFAYILRFLKSLVN